MSRSSRSTRTSLRSLRQLLALGGRQPVALTRVDLGLRHPATHRRLGQIQVAAHLCDVLLELRISATVSALNCLLNWRLVVLCSGSTWTPFLRVLPSSSVSTKSGQDHLTCSGSGEPATPRTVRAPDRGSLRPPAPVRCSARKLAAHSLPGRPPATCWAAVVRLRGRYKSAADNRTRILRLKRSRSAQDDKECGRVDTPRDVLGPRTAQRAERHPSLAARIPRGPQLPDTRRGRAALDILRGCEEITHCGAATFG